MKGEGGKIKSKQASKRDRTLSVLKGQGGPGSSKLKKAQGGLVSQEGLLNCGCMR